MTSFIKDNEMFVSLVRIAQENPDTRKRLLEVLSLEEPQRTPLLHEVILDAQLRQLPHDFVIALSYLLSADVSRATLDLLKREIERSPTSAQRGKWWMLVPIVAVALIVRLYWGMYQDSIKRHVSHQPHKIHARAAQDAECNLIRPDYPAEAWTRGETGTVCLRFIMSASGTVDAVTVVSSSGHGALDKVAVQSLLATRFDMATTNVVTRGTNSMMFRFEIPDYQEESNN